ncbi:hypothetical protein SAMN05421544_101252 [Riemerella columbipharyngis]|uniref:Lipoprotein n=1 Tax=Riemerella columbipharyngis TaxID=1071918 RepID=A0A1G6YUI8_9FLAO|nr:hypothetical protein SAMN05421544_101252 [Riemerella columbipharyngis]
MKKSIFLAMFLLAVATLSSCRNDKGNNSSQNQEAIKKKFLGK